MTDSLLDIKKQTKQKNSFNSYLTGNNSYSQVALLVQLYCFRLYLFQYIFLMVIEILLLDFIWQLYAKIKKK